MKKVLESVKNALDDTGALFGEGLQSATDLLKETLSNFYDVKNLTTEKLAVIANDLIALSPIIEKTGYRTKEINIGVSLPPKIIFHFEKFADISKEEIAEILKANDDKTILKVIVGTLTTADEFQSKLTLGNFKFSEIDIEVGVPPQVNVKLMNVPAS
ncbi:MAG: hypothetical protein WBP43_00435 [Chitinophagales bacterium]|nr:hypothetical protein [Bacteroidota bacterium]